MFARAALCCFILLLRLELGHAKNNYEIIINTLKCRAVRPLAITEMNCILHRKRTPIISARFQLNETFQYFDIHTTFDLYKKDNTRMNVADLKMDGCKYLGSMYESNILGKLFRRFKKFTNLPTGCPILKGKLYEIRNYTFRSDEYPPNVPGAKWQVRTRLLRRAEVIGDILMEGQLVYNT
ncbi:uncharacterized protein LOC111067916 [Drosophila obscura]|uniref:uncharacterized protein LOC111067916 n=1 Tax=Drosophila obscura TaxID=7282 RepID=UPI001BB1B0B3|nr:uncharacterized protein LOC111067916 [Drosophila obscura]